MELQYIYAPDRIYAQDETGKLLAQIKFPPAGEGVINFSSTFVDPSLRGQGIADQLVRRAVALIRERGMKATVTCSYVQAWFDKNPEERDVLA
jgi:predicted GNAT family acetyltransferase